MHKKFGKSLEDKFNCYDLTLLFPILAPFLQPPILFQNLSLAPFPPPLSPLAVASYSWYYLHLFFLRRKRAN